jgi:hypothetical protein
MNAVMSTSSCVPTQRSRQLTRTCGLALVWRLSFTKTLMRVVHDPKVLGEAWSIRWHGEVDILNDLVCLQLVEIVYAGSGLGMLPVRHFTGHIRACSLGHAIT